MLARGGMSTVYRGVDTRLERPVAIKVMDQRLNSDRTFTERFVLEAKSAARLHHPNVVAVHDQGVDRGASLDGEDDRVFLIMELVDGGTLRDLLFERTTLSPTLALTLMEPVLSALSSAHRAELVHRDVKPENVLISSQGVVKVADFGLAKAISGHQMTSDSVILGTVAYLSPEQVATGAADQRSDVYSAGILLYEMLTGTTPYTGDTALSVAYRHVNSDVPAPSEKVPGLPPELDQLVLSATRREPDQRPDDAAAFLLAVQSVRNQLGLARIAIPAPGSGAGEAPASASMAYLNGTPQYLPTEPAPVPQQQAPVYATPAPDATERMLPPAGTLPAPPAGAWSMDRYNPPPPPVPPQQQFADQRTKDRRTTKMWIGAIALLALLVAGFAWFMGSGNGTTVPGVAGLSQQEATDLLTRSELNVKIVQRFDNAAAKGQVLGTDPPAGTEVSRGTDIQLAVSKGKPIVPAIQQGITVDEAKAILKKAELEGAHEPKDDEYSATVPKERVIRVDPQSGSPAVAGTPVRIIASKGPAPKPVPNVIGLPKDQAFAALQQAGYQPIDGGNGNDPTAVVSSIDPQAGTKGEDVPESKITVKFTTATIVPNVVGKRANEAAQILKNAGLKPKLVSFFPGSNSPVTNTNPAAGTRVRPGTEIAVFVSFWG
ncbi:Stk1 family PASTA domain-containing Ser/Thr kinase [Pseudonocardiaceae bacterium YIM PH 21723]|nr:Stk1 family PASTA domain-containing Ser/Thr kinase [Pseudonocardiaceae bacterium YIM PH 21723]